MTAMFTTLEAWFMFFFRKQELLADSCGEDSASLAVQGKQDYDNLRYSKLKTPILTAILQHFE